MLIMGIDTSGNTASVAIGDNEKIIAQTTIFTKLTHSQIILPLVERVIKDADLTLADLDGFAVANGPGSYTGLRIGISAVKAMCFSLKKSCVGISTLQSLAQNCVGSKAIILPIMRARPDIAYYGIYQSDGETLSKIVDDNIAPIEQIANQIKEYEDIILVGDNAQEFYNKFNGEIPNMRLAPLHERLQNATSLCQIAQNIEAYPPENLDTAYLQITKAEKEKNEEQK